MKIQIKRIDQNLPLPAFETKGSVGFDFYSRTETIINPNEIALIPTNFIIQIPDQYMLIIAMRSSTPLKRGLLIPNGIGVIDQDYCGPKDEIKVMVYNFTKEKVVIKQGDRIAQGVFVKISNDIEWNQTNSIEATSRGGFGSTG